MSKDNKIAIFIGMMVACIVGIAIGPDFSNWIGSALLILLILIVLYMIHSLVVTFIELDFYKQEDIEWEKAIILAKLQETRITEKISPILLKEAKNSFKKQKEAQEIATESKAKIKAIHIVEIWNQLFLEEKEESQE